MRIVHYFQGMSAKLLAKVQLCLLSAFTPAEPKYQGAVAIVLDSHGNTVLPQEQVEQWLQVDIDVDEQERTAAALNNIDVRSESGFMDLSNEDNVCAACSQEYRCNKRMQDACEFLAIQQAGFEVVADSAATFDQCTFSNESTISKPISLKDFPEKTDTGPVGFNLTSSLSLPNSLNVTPAGVPDRGATYSGVGTSENLTKVLATPLVFETLDNSFTFTRGDGLSVQTQSSKPNLRLVK